MAEQTQAETPVSQAPLDVYQRMQNVLEQSSDSASEHGDSQDDPVRTDRAPADDSGQQPDDPASSELTVDDLPEDQAAKLAQAQSAVEEFEIVHNGTQVKLTREKTIELARQGFDYTQKTQALAEQQRQTQERLRVVQELERVQPMLVHDFAQVTVIEAQLKPYQNVDWVQLATEQPSEYPKWRAQYDRLVQGYQGAVGQLQQKRNGILQAQEALNAQTLQTEAVKLRDKVKAWQDPARYSKEAPELKAYLIEQGVPAEYVDRLSDSTSVSIAYKAMQYDRLLKAKTDKVKQLRTAPPVTRPGATQSTDAANADKATVLRGRLKKSGDLNDAAALILNRMK